MKMRNRHGVTLVELLVAMVMLAVLLTSVAALTFEAARSSVVVAGEQYRQGVTLETVNRLTAVRYTALANGSTCQTTSTGVFPHTLCIKISGVGLYAKQVQVIVTPTQPGVRPDTVTFIRANPPIQNPLSM